MSTQKDFNLAGIKGAIFDMDGTMVDNQQFHRNAWLTFAERHGLKWTEEEIREKTSGKKNAQILPILLQRELQEGEIDQFASEKEEIYRELYKGHITSISGLLNTITALKAHGIKLAIATTAPKDNRDFILGELGITGQFDTILGEEDFTEGKPHPELLQNAAAKLKLNTSTCIMFDDAPIGVEAAHRAGMKIICLTTTHTKEEFNNADLLINTFDDLHFTP